MDRDKVLTRWRLIDSELDQIDAGISQRFEQAEAGELSYAKCDELNADARERVHELAGALSSLLRELLLGDEPVDPARP